MSTVPASVIELSEDSNQHLDPYVIIADRPDPRAVNIHKAIQQVNEDRENCADQWAVTYSHIKERSRKAENGIKQVIHVHDASKTVWTMLGSLFAVLVTLNLVKGGHRVRKWYKNRRQTLGAAKQRSNEKLSISPRKHAREWNVDN